MSEIPSHIASSAAQAALQAGQVAKEREARQAGQADAASRQIKSVDEAGSTVDTNNEDVAVFKDAEGEGSQGSEPTETEAEQEPAAEADEGVTQGDDGRLHLDLEA